MLFMENKKVKSNEYGKEYTKDSESYKKLAAFQEALVQQTIDFINSNPEIIKLIEDKKAEIYATTEPKYWNMLDDITVSFNVDGLNVSLENKKWHPGSDSSMSIFVGQHEVIGIM